jgi:hypothetical protein
MGKRIKQARQSFAVVPTDNRKRPAPIGEEGDIEDEPMKKRSSTLGEIWMLGSFLL